jgi:RimJ/RimL family protein N-acetyltransferase
MAPHLVLREATPADEAQLLRWRNDVEARRQFFSRHEVSPADHRRWLAGKLADREATRLLVAEVDGRPIGQARVDRTHADVGEISVAVDGDFRGRGFGAQLIAAATERAASELGLQRVEARIKASNVASRHAFERAGYGNERTEARDGEQQVVLEWTRG